jgi:epsilon-lactone hydrolase
MTVPAENTSSLPIDRVIARISAIYRCWTRETPVARMRSDWDAAFSACTVPVISKPVSANGINSEWIIPPHASHEKAILYLHGGGFRLGSVSSHRDLIARIAEASGCRCLAINYRLAPEHRFPAPIEDTLAAYHWMQDQGIKPADIVIVGDSAGGNLALAAMLSLRQRGLPLPVAAALISPWTDLTASGASYASRATADPIHQRKMILALAKDYLGDDGDARGRLASPLFADLAGLPPLLIQVGDRETVLDDSIQLAERARASGVDVELQVWDGMIHVFQMFSELAETRCAIASLSEFLCIHLRVQTGSYPP